MYQPEFVDIPPEFQIVRTNEVAPGIIPLNTDGRKRECSPVNSERKKIDVAVLDMKMDGIQTLKQIRQKFPLIEVILLTGHGSTETAIQGMKLGAYDYLLKPADFDDLVGKLEGARKRKDEQEERIRAAEARFLLRRSGGAF
jgi:DNA-binding NtrC family response regulator